MRRDWQDLISNSIPLVSALAVSAEVAGGQPMLRVPLAPNVNDKGTAFGGSIAAISTLAGWCAVLNVLDSEQLGEGVEIVIQRGATEYLRPIAGDFLAVPQSVEAGEAQRFLKMFARRGLARLTIKVDLMVDNMVHARFAGEYVATRVKGG